MKKIEIILLPNMTDKKMLLLRSGWYRRLGGKFIAADLFKNVSVIKNGQSINFNSRVTLGLRRLLLKNLTFIL